MTAAMAGRKVLVTGASSGIGAAIADAIVADGGRVALVARSAATVEQQAGRLGDAVAAPADVTDAATLADTIRRAAGEMGGLDAVVGWPGSSDPEGSANRRRPTGRPCSM